MKKNRLMAVFVVAALLVAVCIGGIFAVLNRPPQPLADTRDYPPLLLTFEDLNFETAVPGLMRGHIRESRSQWQSGGETAVRVNLLFETEAQSAVVLGFEEMSESLFEKTAAEGGPMGMLLGRSKNGRVVLFWGPQSNPFIEGTPEFELFSDFPKRIRVVFETFRFLDE